jgi:hypothetical protein
MKITYQQAYLTALKSRLVQLEQVSTEQLTDNVLESILGSPNGRTVKQQIRGLKGEAPAAIAGLVTKFINETYAVPVGSNDPAPPPLIVNFNPGGLEKVSAFAARYKAGARNLGFNWNGSVDFNAVVDLAREVNPDFTTSFDTGELREIDREKWAVLRGDFLKQVLLPVNWGLFANPRENQASTIMDFRIKRKTWHQKIAYVDHVIWLADAVCQQNESHVNSQTFENYILLDRDEALKQGLLVQDKLITTPANFQLSVVKKFGLERSLYASVFTYNRLIKKQTAAARNQILVNEWITQNGNEVFGLTEDERYVKALLVDDPKIKQKLGMIKESGLKKLVVDQFASHLCGLIDEMEEQIGYGNPEYASLGVFDFYGIALASKDVPGSSIAYKVSLLGQRLIQEEICANPGMLQALSDLNVSHLASHANVLLEGLKEIRDNNLKDVHSVWV